MTLLEPVHTPLADINLFKDGDGELWIQQNNLTVALGYSKYLGRNKKRGSGLGKYFHGNVMKKLGNLNLLNLRLVVESVLPQFLKGFFRAINGQPSRQKLFGNKPADIFHNTEAVLTILKERLNMCYDPNSPEARKGALGENIVDKYLSKAGYDVEVPIERANGSASVVDFEIFSNDRLVFCAEVKTQAAYPYGIEQAPCYSFPKDKIDAYVRYAHEHDKPVNFYVVDPTDGFVRFANIFNLLKPTIIARQFPSVSQNNGLNCICYYFHREQFGGKFAIEPNDLAELRKLFGIESKPTQEPDKETAPEEKPAPSEPATKNADILTAPNGTIISIIKATNDSRFFVKASQIDTAIGNVAHGISPKSTLMTAAKTLGVTEYHTNDFRNRKVFLLAVDDVPRVLSQYYKNTCTATPKTKKFQRAQEALRLRDWFQSVVLPQFGSSHVEKQEPAEPPQKRATLAPPANDSKTDDISPDALIRKLADTFQVETTALAAFIADERTKTFEREQKTRAEAFKQEQAKFRALFT